jgi:hypothetical protein
MFKNTFVNLILNIIPRNKWNLFSKLLAKMSIPTIGSPVSFKYGNYTLKEFNMLEMPVELKANFFNFCYPLCLKNRKYEIELDRQYWPDAATFLVFDTNNTIVGCAQFILKKKGNKIPIEFAYVATGADNGEGNINYIVPKGRFAEIYRCRRSFALDGMTAISILLMIFKAIYIKALQTGTEYSLITCDSSIDQLKKLYIKKLSFIDPNITVNYGNSNKAWNLLIKDWKIHESQFSSISKSHFYIQTMGRKNLKRKYLKTRPLRPVVAQFFSEEDTIPFIDAMMKEKSETAMKDVLLETTPTNADSPRS